MKHYSIIKMEGVCGDCNKINIYYIHIPQTLHLVDKQPCIECGFDRFKPGKIIGFQPAEYDEDKDIWQWSGPFRPCACEVETPQNSGYAQKGLE